MLNYDSNIVKQIENLLNVGIALSAGREHNEVLELILTEARRITNADAGTLYLYEDGNLIFKFIQNETLNIHQGGNGEKIELPPVPVSKENVAGYTALTGSIINIDDVYNTDRFNFSGPRKYDQITGYRTGSILVAPMEDYEGQIIGVLQLINARDDHGQTIPFAPYLEKVVSSLASQAAVSINNLRFLQEVQNLLKGMVESMAIAVDSRTPYNANHTLRIARMIQRLINVINNIEEGPFADEYFDKNRAEELVMSAWLHDIGKIGIPLTVMNKSSKLEGKLELILQRFDYIELLLEMEMKEMKDSGQDTVIINERIKNLKNLRELIIAVNEGSKFVDNEVARTLRILGNQRYMDRNGEQKHWLRANELEALSVRRGTLIESERKQIENHVNIAVRILRAIPFPERLNNVSNWVSMHHEYLDGSGYPKGLKGDELPLEARILAVLDIFDALVAADRPYKKSKPVTVALDILEDMVEQGKLDQDVLTIFRENNIWEAMSSEDDDSYQIW